MGADRAILPSKTIPKSIQRALRGWDNCERCGLCSTRRRVVHYRGPARPDLLFLGEAPGKDEDKVGLPFVGRSGRLLDQLAEEAVPASLSWGVANIVGCLPLDSTKSIRPPSDAEVAACTPRLLTLLSLLAPSRVVLLGKTSAKRKNALPLPEKVLELRHPAYILRLGGRMTVEGAKFVVTLRDWLREEEA